MGICFKYIALRNMIVKCKSCGKEFEVSARIFNSYIKNGWNFYCSSECRSLGRQRKTKHICAFCGKEFERIPSAKKSKNGLYFCSQSCAASYNNSHYRLGENNPNYIDGSYKSSHYAKIAFRNYKHKCAVCGLDEECCLQVHHIDCDRGNDSLDNLIILCANCHCRVHRGGLNLEDYIKNREVQ